MTAISAKIIYQARTPQTCVTCLGPIKGAHVYMFGYAETGDPRHCVRQCLSCAERVDDPVIAAVFPVRPRKTGRRCIIGHNKRTLRITERHD